MDSLEDTLYKHLLLANERLETAGRFAGRAVATDLRIASYLILQEISGERPDLEEYSYLLEELESLIPRWVAQKRIVEYREPAEGILHLPEDHGPWYRIPPVQSSEK